MTPRTVICDKHFLPSDINISLVTRKWTLKTNVEPSVFLWTTSTPVRKPPKERIPLTVSPVKGTQNQQAVHNISQSFESMLDIGFQDLTSGPTTRDIGCQTEDVMPTETTTCIRIPADHEYCSKAKLASSKVERLETALCEQKAEMEKMSQKIQELNEILTDYELNRFGLDKICDDESAMLFYTGFPSTESFNAFYNFLETKCKGLKYWRGQSGHEEAHTSGTNKVGRKRAIPIRKSFSWSLYTFPSVLEFQRVTSVKYLQLGSTFCRMNFLHYSQNMPLEFSQYPTTRIIIDCTEIFIEVSSTMSTQSQTWSSYKHNNTWKFIVGISPNGTLTYISGLSGGRVSDKEITKKCGLLDLMESGDNIMADRDGVMPLSLAHSAENIVKVIGYLTNFLPPLLPPGHSRKLQE
ncbi:hypothetical protein MAR_021809 [Mya arenaria]|uniref:DDE Tnp4 domain-containing protein n=1 Tax=Mya arenaria TaxID=6604 RepID=A0ABY7E8T8_MYAAR|nr:hypothetical protein MAR_021809 [Mya arenaria]